MFQTDNAWPTGLLDIFELSRSTHPSLENRYYGAYDKLLNYCFGSAFNFYVAPQSPPRHDSHETVDFIVFVVLNKDGKPVLAVEVKDDVWARTSEHRYNADEQMRSRYRVMFDHCPAPRLWGLSALGTSTRIYCGDTALRKITPPHIPRPGPVLRNISPSFLAGEWDLDLLSQEGFEKMKEIVLDILTHVETV